MFRPSFEAAISDHEPKEETNTISEMTHYQMSGIRGNNGVNGHYDISSKSKKSKKRKKKKRSKPPKRTSRTITSHHRMSQSMPFDHGLNPLIFVNFKFSDFVIFEFLDFWIFLILC